MKKTLSMLLAVMLVLSLGVTAFATTPSDPPATDEGASTAKEASEFKFAKKWYDADGELVPAELVPDEELSFEVKNVSYPESCGDVVPMISIADKTQTVGNPQDIVITVPAYAHVGYYKYIITEVAGDTQGVIYSTSPIEVEVMVSNGETGLVKTVYFTKKVVGADGAVTEAKVESIDNTYNYTKPGIPEDPENPNNPKYIDFTVDKVVKGNLGDKENKFEIKVFFSSAKPVRSTITYNGDQKITPDMWNPAYGGGYDVQVTLMTSGNDPAISFSHVPAGVGYTVSEANRHTMGVNDSKYNNDPDRGYEAHYYGGNEGGKEGWHNKGTIVEGANGVIVENTKTAKVNTGIELDSLPYVIMITVAVLGVVLFTLKKRSAED